MIIVFLASILYIVAMDFFYNENNDEFNESGEEISRKSNCQHFNLGKERETVSDDNEII